MAIHLFTGVKIGVAFITHITRVHIMRNLRVKNICNKETSTNSIFCFFFIGGFLSKERIDRFRPLEANSFFQD